MSVNFGSEVRQGTANSIDIQFRFVEGSRRLTVDGLRQSIQAVIEILGFADVATYSRNSSKIDRNQALNFVGAMGQSDLRRVSYQSPLEIVVIMITSTSTMATAFRVIRLGERVADLRDRWAASKAHVARSEMEAAYYKMLEEQIHGEGSSLRRYLNEIQPLTKQVARDLLDVESIEEQPDPAVER